MPKTIPKKFLDLYYKQGYRIVGKHQQFLKENEMI